MKLKNHKKTVLFIGLDGVGKDYLERVKEKTSLLKKITEEGYFVSVKTLLPTISPAAWNSMFTGCEPIEHNIFDFKDPVKNRLVTKKEVKAPLVWDFLARYNISFCVIGNVCYFSTKFKEKNGIVIPTPIYFIKSMYNSFGNQRILPADKEKQFIKYLKLLYHITKRIYSTHKTSRFHFERWKAIKFVYMSAKLKIKIAELLYSTLKPRFLAIIFNETDILQHFFYDKKDVLDNFMIFLDKELSTFLESIRYEDSVSHIIVASDHGFDKVATKLLSLTTLIRYISNRKKDKLNRILLEYLADNVRYLLYKGPIIKYLFYLKPNLLNKINSLSRKTIKPKESGALKSPSYKSNYYGYIRIYKGNDLILFKKLAKTMDLVHIKGKKVFSDVKFEQIDDGEAIILFRLNKDFRLYSKNFFRNKLVLHNIAPIKGDHVAGPDGIFLLKCTNKCEKSRQEINEIPITAISPLILNLFGISIPEYMLYKLDREVIDFVSNFGKIRVKNVKKPKMMKLILKLGKKFHK